MTLVLASTSTGRRQLLERLGVPFSCEAPGLDEGPFHARATAPDELALELARAKARAVAERHPHAIVIGGDQVAARGEEILHQPGSAARACEQLLSLAGREHCLHTATCVVHPAGEETWLEQPRLWMRDLTAGEVRRYVEADEPFGCAGSYKLEARGISLFERIEAEDWNAIVGLPLLRLSSVLRSLGVELP